jgi:hypothetical protein
VVAGVGIAGWLLLVLGLVRWSVLLGWGLAGFGAEYAVFLRLRGGSVDARAPAVAAALLLVAELSYLSVTGVAGADRALKARMVGAAAAAVAGVALLADLVLVVSGSANGSLPVEAGGVLAAVLSVAFVVRVARPRGSTST